MFVRVDGLDKPIALALPNSDRNMASDLSESRSVSISWRPENAILLGRNKLD